MIKKLVVLLLMSFMITGCTKIPNTTTETSTVDNKESSKILIAYFSWADNTVVENEKASIESALKHYESIGDQNDNVDATSSASILQPGNVGKIATWIQENIGGDLFSIQVTIPYPSNYDECLDRAADEKTKNARPVLKEKVDNLNDYDTVLLGIQIGGIQYLCLCLLSLMKIIYQIKILFYFVAMVQVDYQEV